MKHVVLKCGICSALLAINSAYADISFNGFGTIAGGITTGSDERLDGYDDSFSFDNDSVFGLQANADLGEGLTAVAQVIARGNNDWDAEFEWAYVGYEVNDHWKIIAGRQRIPLFLFSDYLDVGYAYMWITPPEGVYDLELTSIDGIGSNFNFMLGETDNTLQVAYGRSNKSIDIGNGSKSASDIKDFATFVWSMNYDWLTLRAIYASAEVSIDSEDLQKLSNAWGETPYSSVGADLRIDEEDTVFYGLSAMVDYEDWLFVTEYTHIDYDNSALGENESYYATLGYRLTDELAVLFTYGHDKDDPNFGALKNVPNPSGNPALDGLYDITTAALDSRAADEDYYIIGGRWDFHPSAALKIEYKYLEDNYDAHNRSDPGLVRVAISTVF